MAKRLNAIGCNIFAGLFTVGVQKHFNVLAHLEHDNYGTRTAQLNWPRMPIHIGVENWPKHIQAIDFVYSNPPCAVWSPIGRSSISGVHWREDPRLQRARDAHSLIARYRPKVWAWESVPQALRKGRGFIHEMAEGAARIGYATTVLQINAKFLGVPQDRPRIFVVCHRVQFEPAPCDYDNIATVRDAWKNFKNDPEELRNQRRYQGIERPILEYCPPGMSLRRAFDLENGTTGEGFTKGRPGIAQKRLSFDKPGIPVIICSWHPKEPRRITAGEAKRICQLPDDFKFESKSQGTQMYLMQRAVMPGVGEWLARGVKNSILRDRPIGKPAALVMDLMRPDGEIVKL